MITDMISTAPDFQTSVNIAYDLFNSGKVQSLIPTTTAINLFEDVLLSTDDTATSRSRILIGPYGKGKSHIILSILSFLCHKDVNSNAPLLHKIHEVNPKLYDYALEYISSSKRLLPVIINGSNISLVQSFMGALYNTLKTFELAEVMPETHFQAAIKMISLWKSDYPDTLCQFQNAVNMPADEFAVRLSNFDVEAYTTFEKIYPSLTSGSEFNPFSGFDVIELYEKVINVLPNAGFSGIFVVYYNFSLKKRGAVIWLAHTVELLQQAYETFASVWQHLGDGQINAYKLWGKRKVSIPHQGFQGILFCGIQKLQSIYQSQPELFAQILQDVRLIIFDEAHKSSAPETRQLIDALMTIPAEAEDRSLLGLTATPGRTTLTSEENKLLSDVFENRLISIDIDVVNQVNMSQTAYLNHPKETNIIHYFQQANILAKIKKEQLVYTEQFTLAQLRSIKVQMLENGYADFSRSTLEMIGRNRSRNTAIMNKLRELFTDQVPTIVFACSVAHAKLLMIWPFWICQLLQRQK